MKLHGVEDVKLQLGDLLETTLRAIKVAKASL
jgi:hypothetical protein